MADPTLKNFAVKITSDTTDLQTGFDKLKIKLEELSVSFKTTFGIFDSESKKISKELSQTIGKNVSEIGKNAEAQITQVQKATDEKLKAVTKGSKEEKAIVKQNQDEINKIKKEGIKAQNAQLRQQTQEAARELKNQLKVLDREAEQFGELDVVQINKTQPVQDVQELGRVIKSSNKTTQEEIRTQLKRLDSQKIADIKDAEQKLKRILARAQGNQTQAAKEAAKRRLQQADLTAEKRLKIEQDLQRQLLRIQQQGVARQQATRQTSARRQQQAPGERRTGRIGRGGALISEVGQSAQRAAGPLGAFGAALGKLGPIGIAAAAGLGALVLGFKKAFEVSEEFEDGQARIRTLLTEQQAMDLGAPMLQLRDAAKETGESIKVLQEGLFFTISAVPELANNIDAAASITVKASKAAIGLGASTDEVVLAAAGLGNALGLNIAETEAQNQIFDVLANTMKQGVIPSGQELAANIAKTAPTMGFLAEKSDEALKVIGAMTAQMTGAGISTAEAQTQIKSLANELLKTSTRTALLKEGMKGVDAETGKVKDWRLLFQSMGEDVGKFTSMFSRKEAQNAIRIFTKNGGEDFDKMLTSFDQAGGTAETMFDTMASTGEATSKRLSATWNDLWITLGEGSVPFVNDVRNSAAMAIEAINDFFKSSEQQAAESQERFQQSIDIADQIGDSIKTVEESITAAGVAGADKAGIVATEIQRIGETADQFKDTFPLLAANIQSIINAEGEKTVETLRILNEQLGRAQDLAQTEAFLEGFEGAAAGLDSIVEKIESIGPLGKFAADQFSAPFGDGIGFINESLEGIDQRVNELFAEQDTLDFTNPEDVERMQELSDELVSLTDKQDQLGRARLATEAGMQQFADTQIEQARKLAESRGLTFNLDQQMLIIRNQLTAQFGKEGETLEFINQLTTDRAETERILSEEKAIASAREAGDLQTVIDLENQKKQLKIDELNSQMQLLDMKGLLTEEQKTAIQSQIESLDVSKKAFGVTADAVDFTKDLVSVNKDLTEEKETQVDISEEESFISSEINDMTSEILDNETLTTDAKIEQLEKLEAAFQVELDSLNVKLAKLEADHEGLVLAAEAVDLSEEESKAAWDKVDAIRKQVEELRKQATIVATGKTELGGKITETGAGGLVTETLGGIGGRGAGREAQRTERARQREEDKAAKEAAKAEKEKLKAQEKMEKEKERRAKEAEDAREKLENEREKRREEDAKRFQEMNDAEVQFRIDQLKRQADLAKKRQEAEKQAIESMKEFRKALENTIESTRMELITGLRETVTGFNTIKDEYEKAAAEVGTAIEGASGSIIDQIRQSLTKTSTAKAKIDEELAALRLSNAIETAVLGFTKAGEVPSEVGKTSSERTSFASQIDNMVSSLLSTNSAVDKALRQSGFTEAQVIELVKLIQGTVGARANFELTEETETKNIVAALVKLSAVQEGVDLTSEQIRDILLEIEKGQGISFAPKVVETDTDIADLSQIGQFTTLSKLFGLLKDDLTEALNAFESAGSIEQLETAGLQFSRLTEDLNLAQFSLGDLQGRYTGLLDVIEALAIKFDETIGTEEERLALFAERRDQLSVLQKQMLDTLLDQGKISADDLAIIRTKIPLLIKQTELLDQQLNAQIQLAETQAELLRNQDAITEAIEVTTNLANEYETALADTEITQESINEKHREQGRLLLEANATLVEARRLLTENDIQLEALLATKKEELAIDMLDLATRKAALDAIPTEELTEEQIASKAALTKEINTLNISIREQEDSIAATTEEERLNQEGLDNSTDSINENSIARQANLDVQEKELDLFDKKQVADFISEMTTQIGTLNTTSLTGFVSTIGNSLRGVTDLFEKAAEATGENAEDLRDAAMEGMSKIAVDTAQVFEQVAANVEQGFEKITNIAKQFKAGVSGAITTGVGDLTTQIGKALISAGGPLAIAGAVILGVGLITKAVGQIINAIKGREQTALEKAEERLATIERQNDEIRSQIALMNDLAALGDASVDTARERLDLLEKQKQELIKQNAEFDKPQEALLEEKRDLEGLVTQYEDFNDRLEQGREFSNSAQRKLVRDFNEAFGTAFDFGDNITKSDIDDLVALTSGHIAVAQGDLEKLELITEVNESILQEQFNLLSERVKSAEFRIKIATEFEDPDLFLQSQEDLINTLGDKLNTALLKAGVGTQITDLTKDELLNLRDEFEALFAEGEVPADIIDSWGELLEAIEGNNQKEREFVEAMLEDEKQMIELIRLREGADEITEKQANEQVLKILEDELAIVDEQIEALGLTNELEMLRLGLLQEINDLKNDNNDADEEANRLLTIALRNRQQLLESIRAEQGGAPISIEQQNRLAQSEEQIVNQLRATGMSDPDIQSFLTTLPAFEEGGIVPKTGPVIAHEGEWIIPANQVKEIEDQIKSFASIFAANNPTIMGTDAITQDFTRTVLEKEAQNIQNNAQINTQFGDIIINIPSGVEEPEKIALAVKNELDGMVLGTVQRGIDQNKLDFRGKKT